jgi:hypothetical protein
MYIEIPDALTGPIQLEDIIDNTNSNMMVGLREITYTSDWFNISDKLGNNVYKFRDSREQHTAEIYDGYYNLELLEKIVQYALPGFKLEHNLESDRLKITIPAGSQMNFLKLSDLLGCKSGWISSITCEKPHKFYTHKSLYVYLDKINTSKNILVTKQIGRKSNLLRKIATTDIQHGESTTISFERPQFRQLCDGSINELTISILDINGNKININYCNITLEINALEYT